MTRELKKILDSLVGQADLNGQEADRMMDLAFAMDLTEEQKREAGQYLVEMINKRKRPDVDVKGMLGEISPALNLSYIAKRYFDKDRTWLYQRINHTPVNGKPAVFTQNELKRLSDSLAELSNKIHQISIQLTH